MRREKKTFSEAKVVFFFNEKKHENKIIWLM